VERRRLFKEPRDYAKFLALLAECRSRFPVTVLAYCVMPNHWHLVMIGHTPTAISAALQWLTCRHACDLRRCEGTVGYGHVYQRRFKSFAIGSTRHLLNVLRYVEGNAFRAGLVERAEEWQWGSVWDRPRESTTILGALPFPLPDNWVEIVNTLPSPALLRRLEESLRTGKPYGSVKRVRKPSAREPESS
jgi:putative transposase